MPRNCNVSVTAAGQPLDLEALDWLEFVPLPKPENVHAVRMDQPFTLHWQGPGLHSQQHGGTGDWLVALPNGGFKIMRHRAALDNSYIPPDRVMQEHYEPRDGFWCLCGAYVNNDVEGTCSAPDEGPFCPQCCKEMAEDFEEDQKKAAASGQYLCPQCGEKRPLSEAMKCPRCLRDGCPECMPAGRGCLCPECEAGEELEA